MKKILAIFLALVLMFAFSTGALAKGKSDNAGRGNSGKSSAISDSNEINDEVETDEENDGEAEEDLDDEDENEDLDDEDENEDLDDEDENEDLDEDLDDEDENEDLDDEEENEDLAEEDLDDEDENENLDDEDENEADNEDDQYDKNKIAEKALKNRVKALEKRVDMLKDKAKIVEKELEVREKIREERLERLENVLKSLGKELDEIEDVIKDYQPARGRFRVKGKHPVFDVPPVIKDGRTLIPVRAITEGLGAEVEWDGEEQKVKIEKDGRVIEIYLGSQDVLVNGQAITIDVPADMLANRVFVPVRFISETLGDPIEYDPETGDITVGEDTEEATVEDEGTEDSVLDEETSTETETEVTDDTTNEESTTDNTETPNN